MNMQQKGHVITISEPMNMQQKGHVITIYEPMNMQSIGHVTRIRTIVIGEDIFKDTNLLY